MSVQRRRRRYLLTAPDSVAAPRLHSHPQRPPPSPVSHYLTNIPTLDTGTCYAIRYNHKTSAYFLALLQRQHLQPGPQKDRIHIDDRRDATVLARVPHMRRVGARVVRLPCPEAIRVSPEHTRTRSRSPGIPHARRAAKASKSRGVQRRRTPERLAAAGRRIDSEKTY